MRIPIRLVFFVSAYVVMALAMLLIRQRIGYMTPDEINFSNDNYRNAVEGVNFSLWGGSGGGLALKYYAMSVFFQFLYRFGTLAIYFFNIMIVAAALFVSYNALVRDEPKVCGRWWLLMFMMPNVLYYSASILRDIQLFALVLFLLALYKRKAFGVMFLLVLGMIWILRPELGLTVSVAWLISIMGRPWMKRYAVLGYLIAAFGFMAYLALAGNYYTNFFSRGLAKHGGIGILNFTDANIHLPYFLLSNIALFYFPIVNEFFLTSSFGNMMVFCGLVNLYILCQVFFRYGLSFSRNDRMADFALLAFITFIPVLANESDASSAVRHSIYTLPFLYLYFIRCLAANRRVGEVRNLEECDGR